MRGYSTAYKVFRRTYNGQPNIVTPNVIEYVTGQRYVVELSQGEGLFGGDLFGVTVLTLDGSRTELSRSFDHEDDAREYIATLI